ncbi:MBL fold metallo-hydrolase [Paracidovorax valerianellae]|uniref:L-ascorbate metabolism protein UlaG, beta-lactamase superfamily n=1 Tax=Paracidovorax valerianellae TaxID=187868 RepID=A0A1G6XJL6_9BURK|nr:L-ascorbate metabolism protein UlaG, beta-lactamase superfamily [Paracidovorax valerianellae]
MAHSMFSCSESPVASYAESPQYAGGRFRNVAPRHRLGTLKMLSVMWRFAVGKPANTVPGQPIAVQPLTTAALLQAPDLSLWRLGHSTMLMKLDGHFWLTDPVFSERASPVQFAGPKRFHAPPLRIEDLPPIKGVILSHDHYDHLDHAAVLKLAPKVEHFVAPLGVGDRLVAWGVPAAKVQQFDWWQGTTIGGVRLVATPAQHFSGRSLSDGNRTLWASWVIMAADLRIFFSGDTGYFDGFKAIGERYGPFDLTMVETGAYNADWPDVHMQPEQSLKAHQDVKGRHMMPIHNGTFDLSLHPWDEPFERITALAAAAGVPLVAPVMGERLDIREPALSRQWWREAVAPAAR